MTAILLLGSLFQWDETGSSSTGSTMSDWGVSNGEFTQIVTQHFWSDFHLVENLTVVDTDDGTDHFWNNDHVSHVGSDWSWLFIFWGSQLGSSQLLHETGWLGSHTTGKSSSNSSWGQLDEIFSGHFQQFFQIDTSVRVGLKNSLLGINSLRHDRS